MSAQKGSEFERTICKRLSAWWVPGRDDLFWRSSQSGGRATIRRRAGKTTYGSYGDITALDPIGEPLLKVFTIELKRGRSHGSLGDLIDLENAPACHPFVKTLLQAIEGHEAAGSRTWLLICRRDRRGPMVYFEFKPIRAIVTSTFLLRYRSVRLKFVCKALGKMDIIGVPLEKFLASVSPDDVRQLADQ